MTHFLESKPPVLKRQADLAEVLARFLVAESVGDLGKREFAVNDRVHIECFQRTNHLDLVATTAHNQAFQTRLFGH